MITTLIFPYSFTVSFQAKNLSFPQFLSTINSPPTALIFYGFYGQFFGLIQVMDFCFLLFFLFFIKKLSDIVFSTKLTSISISIHVDSARIYLIVFECVLCRRLRQGVHAVQGSASGSRADTGSGLW